MAKGRGNLTLIKGGKDDAPPPELLPKVVKVGVHAALDGDTDRTIVSFITLEIAPPTDPNVKKLSFPESNMHTIGGGEDGSLLFVCKHEGDLPFQQEYAPQLKVMKVKLAQPGEVLSTLVSFTAEDAEHLQHALKGRGIETPPDFQRTLATSMRKAMLGAREILLDFRDIEKGL